MRRVIGYGLVVLLILAFFLAPIVPESIVSGPVNSPGYGPRTWWVSPGCALLGVGYGFGTFPICSVPS